MPWYKTDGNLLKESLALSLTVLVMFVSLGPANLILQSQNTSLGNYVYNVKPTGVADVTIVIKGVAGNYDVYVRVDPGVINGSITAFDSQGNMLPTQVINKTLVDVMTANTTDEVIVEYVAIIGEETNGVTSITISPYGNATIKLPPGSALLYFTGNPKIKIISSSITLYYPTPGKHNISFVIQPVTTTTTTSVSISTTLPSTTTTSETTTTTTIGTTLTSSVASSTTTTHTTTTSPKTTTTSTHITTATTHTTTPSTTTPSLTTTPKTTTSLTAAPSGTQTTLKSITSKTKSSVITQPTTSAWENSLLWITLIVIVALILALIAFAFAKGKRGGSHLSSGSQPPSEGPETLESTALDERDIKLLDLVSEKETTISELAKRAGLSKSVVWRRVRKLSGLGLISKEDLGAKTILRITEEGLKALKGRRST